ncbi:hypothetical protein LIER_05662 [Lithospermum erythrorhizon]|uniref:Integrase zinc-binding domain-containing protein n=1 Tax=Lithospermum erythrorhizon TaxID=34254 RepID=A0AAV3P2M8_LITER
MPGGLGGTTWAMVSNYHGVLKNRGPSRRSSSCQQDPEAEFEVQPAGRSPLPKIFSRPTAELRHPRRGSNGGRGDAWGHVRKPHQWKSPDVKDPTVGNILAIRSKGCPRPRTEMRLIPEYGTSQGLPRTELNSLLKYVTREKSLMAVEDMHGGICGSHINGKALMQKILRSGIFWPSVAKDAQDHVWKCDSCQRHASIPHQPPHEMVTMLCPIPFYQI